MSGHRFSRPETVTVRELCRAAGIPYGMEDGPERPVRLRLAGGHERVKMPHRGRPALYVDVSGVPREAKAAARRILEVLAFDLDCYEAGESLSVARIAEPLRNGKYVPARRPEYA